jgi:GTPase SAR1 family protein|tara:strand:+ start:671 stop:1333 length:663 start_codon:yes stop_codon:yes gene_type:complete
VSLLAGFAVFFAEIGIAIYNRLHAYPFGIYGAERVGKTTLARQLQTRGEVPDIKKRTDGIQSPTRKMIKIDGDVRTIKSSDVGGQAVYWKEWEGDMRKRGVEYIIFMIDHRHLESNMNLDNQLAWRYLVDVILNKRWSNGKKKKDKDYPKAVGIWANKFDLWGKELDFREELNNHEIFEPFKMGIQQLNEIGIPCYKYVVSAKTDSKMVYRGITTMIDDY